MSAATAPVVNYWTSLLRGDGRLVVCCEIDHLLPSGMSVQELFARLRPEIAAAIRKAAARDPAPPGEPRAPTVQMDVGSSDPSITLWVHSPATAMGDLDECFRRLEAIVTRFAAVEMVTKGGAT